MYVFSSILTVTKFYPKDQDSVVLQALNCRSFVVSVDDAASLVQGYVTGQI